MTHLKEINYDKSEYVKLLSQVIEKVKEYEIKREAQIKAWKEDDEKLSELIENMWTDCYDYWVSKKNDHDSFWDRCLGTTWSHKSAVKFETVEKEVTTTERVRRTTPLPFWQWLLTLDADYVTVTKTKTVKVETGKVESREEHRARIVEELNLKGYASKYEEFYELHAIVSRFSYKPSLTDCVYNRHIGFLNDTENDLKRVLASTDANYTIDSSQFVRYTKYLTDEVSVS